MAFYFFYVLKVWGIAVRKCVTFTVEMHVMHILSAEDNFFSSCIIIICVVDVLDTRIEARTFSLNAVLPTLTDLS